MNRLFTPGIECTEVIPCAGTFRTLVVVNVDVMSVIFDSLVQIHILWYYGFVIRHKQPSGISFRP